MIISLFVNAVMTMLSALNQSHMQRLILWQMGSFSGRRISHAAVIFGCVTAGAVLTEELLEEAYQFNVMNYLRKISACYH